MVSREEVVRLENVWKKYRLGRVEVNALRGVSMVVYRGESIAIMGPSGSGKTALLNIIATIDKPTRGYVRVCGVEVERLSDEELARFRLENIGIVSQSYNLLQELTALEDTALPLLLKGVPRKEAFKRAKELLELVGLCNRLNHRPYELSGGEQQRVAIARALANNPRLLLLADEPTGNLDLESKPTVLELFKEINKEYQTTIIIVTHDPLVTKYTKKTIRIEDGVLKL